MEAPLGGGHMGPRGGFFFLKPLNLPGKSAAGAFFVVCLFLLIFDVFFDVFYFGGPFLTFLIYNCTAITLQH